MANNENLIPIPGRLHSVATEGHVSGADEIYDDSLQKDQATINQEVQEAIGTGGSVDTKIANAINALDATASQSAGADGLALSVTEVDGKITSISGSIAPDTYDTYGAATTAKTEVIGGATSSGNTLKKLEDRVSPLETAVGSGGSIDTRISNAVNAVKSELKGNATSACDTLGEAEALIAAETAAREAADTALDGRVDTLEDVVEDCAYIGENDGTAVIANFDPQTDTVWKKAQTLSNAEKAQVKANIGVDKDIENLQELYEALTQSDIEVVNAVPASGVANKIYRVVGESSYADYMFNANALTTPIKMAEYNNAIDDEPTAGSENLVKSGGVASTISEFNEWKENDNFKKVVIDSGNRIVSSIDNENNENKYLKHTFHKGVSIGSSGEIESRSSSDYINAILDSKDRVIEGTHKDGSKFIYNFDKKTSELIRTITDSPLTNTGDGSELNPYSSTRDNAAGIAEAFEDSKTEGCGIKLPVGRYNVASIINMYPSQHLYGDAMSYQEGTLFAFAGTKGSRIRLMNEDAHIHFGDGKGAEINRIGIFGLKANDYNTSYPSLFDVEDTTKNCGILINNHYDQCKISKVCLTLLAAGIVVDGATLDTLVWDNINFDGCCNGIWVKDNCNWNGNVMIDKCIFADMFQMGIYMPVSFAMQLQSCIFSNIGGTISAEQISATTYPCIVYIVGNCNKIFYNHFLNIGMTNKQLVDDTGYFTTANCWAMITSGTYNIICGNTVQLSANGFKVGNTNSIISNNVIEGVSGISMSIDGYGNVVSNNIINVSTENGSFVVNGDNNRICNNIANCKLIINGNNNTIYNNSFTQVIDNGNNNVII